MRLSGLAVIVASVVYPSAAIAVASEDHAGHEAHSAEASEHSAMSGALGDYPMARDASGTSWQPDSTPHAMQAAAASF